VVFIDNRLVALSVDVLSSLVKCQSQICGNLIFGLFAAGINTITMDNLEANIMDKSMRSVFVGNIPYEATEEKLKDIFGEVGQVLSFKLVFDRETGKPKGYGFCEYRDQETALSAMRNLNGYEIGGRNLRVDNACTEKSRMEMQNLLNQPPVENPYGEPIQAEKAPEAISKAVASLPPEQMFELMKQMKLCIQNNPTEARQMLLQNPQLAYALLQAQVVMRIIDPITASVGL
jgi:cleavage stimulation factor subunit 2